MEENVVDLLLNHITTKMDVVAVMVVPLIITIIMSMININMKILATNVVAQKRQKNCSHLRNVVVLMVVPLIIIITTVNINMNTITMSTDRKSTRLNSSHVVTSRMPSSA